MSYLKMGRGFLIRVCIVIMAAVLLPFAGNTIESIAAQDQLYYGQPRSCQMYDPVKCPPGTVESGGYCRPLTSEFCKVFTGSSSVTEADGNRPVCAAPPVLGNCDSDGNYFPPAGFPNVSAIDPTYQDKIIEVIRDYVFDDVASLEGIKAAHPNAVMFVENLLFTPLYWDENHPELIRIRDRLVWDFLFSSRWRGTKLNPVKTNGGDTLTLFETVYLEVDGSRWYENGRVNNLRASNPNDRGLSCRPFNSRNWLTIPMIMNLKYGVWHRPFDRSVVEAGLVMPKPSDNNGYCRGNSDVAVSIDPAGSQTKCISGIANVNEMSGCVVAEGEGQSKIDACILGRTGATSTQDTGFGSRIYGSGGQVVQLNPEQSDPQTLQILPAANAVHSQRCYTTAKEFIGRRSNKGCSDFTQLDLATNTLTALPGYENCTKCLYGDNNEIADVYDIPVDLFRYGSTGPVKVEASSFVGNKITPDIEALAKPIAGRLYTDLGGCINASSTGSVVNTIVRVALGVMGGIVILRIIQGALTMQKGDPEGFQEGRDVITSALIGLLLLIFSAALLNFLGINILGLDVATFGS